MTLVLTRAQVRDVDRRAIDDYGMSGLVLMENAGRGCYQLILALCSGKEWHTENSYCAVVCGKGNNGGDGFVIARHLDNIGVPVRVLLIGDAEQLSGDALANYKILIRTDVRIEQFVGPLLSADALRRLSDHVAGARVIVDALLGTGFAGTPREPIATAIRLINAAPGKKLAIDIPSGFECDSGEAAEPTIVADRTFSFVAKKSGMLHPHAAKYCGTIHVIDIGVPRKLLAEIVAESQAD